MQNILLIVQIASSALLVVAVMLQQQGTGLSSVFGGEGNVFRTKRGIEKGLFYATIVIAVVFFSTGIASLIVAK